MLSIIFFLLKQKTNRKGINTQYFKGEVISNKKTTKGLIICPNREVLSRSSGTVPSELNNGLYK